MCFKWTSKIDREGERRRIKTYAKQMNEWTEKRLKVRQRHAGHRIISKGKCVKIINKIVFKRKINNKLHTHYISQVSVLRLVERSRTYLQIISFFLSHSLCFLVCFHDALWILAWIDKIQKKNCIEMGEFVRWLFSKNKSSIIKSHLGTLLFSSEPTNIVNAAEKSTTTGARYNR